MSNSFKTLFHYVSKGIVFLLPLDNQIGHFSLFRLTRDIPAFFLCRVGYLCLPHPCSSELLIKLYFGQCADRVEWGRFPFVAPIKAL